MTDRWSSARERELTKFYNAKLRARRTDCAHAWYCQVTITRTWHLSGIPDGAPGAASPGAGTIPPKLAYSVQPAPLASLERQAPDGHP